MSRVQIPSHEFRFRTSRSGGPGGQNVNKLETRVELLFDVKNSSALNDDQRKLILEKLSSRIDEEGVLRIVAQESRSQWENKQRAIKKLHQVLQKALKPKKPRVKTEPTGGSRERRLERKKKRGGTKRLRARPNET